MRRLTIWITATLAVVALAVAIGMNSLGIGGKEGDEGDHASPSSVQTSTPAPSASASDDGTASDDSTGGDGTSGGDTVEHENKPGENK